MIYSNLAEFNISNLRSGICIPPCPQEVKHASSASEQSRAQASIPQESFRESWRISTIYYRQPEKTSWISQDPGHQQLHLLQLPQFSVVQLWLNISPPGKWGDRGDMISTFIPPLQHIWLIWMTSWSHSNTQSRMRVWQNYNSYILLCVLYTCSQQNVIIFKELRKKDGSQLCVEMKAYRINCQHELHKATMCKDALCNQKGINPYAYIKCWTLWNMCNTTLWSLDNNASTWQKGSFSQTKSSPVTSLIHLMKLLTLGLTCGDFSNHFYLVLTLHTVTKA